MGVGGGKLRGLRGRWGGGVGRCWGGVDRCWGIERWWWFCAA